jgi:hypothetical protein
MATISKEQATHLDLILQLLLDKTVNVSSVEEINENLLRDKTKEYCLSLFYILAQHHPRLLYPTDNLNEDIFWASDYVPAFLHDGGFTALYDTAAAIQEAEQGKEKLNLEKLQYDLKNSKRIFKTYWWTFAFALVSFIYVLIQIVLKIIEAVGTSPGK